MRQYVVLFLILMMPFIPFASQDVEGDVVTTSETLTIEYHGESNNVSILGEWDWNTETELVEVNGVWTAELELSEGLYCYKFIVDGNYIFDPSNSERSYCDGIENSLLRVKNHERPQFSAELLNDTLLIDFIPGSGGGLPDGIPSEITGAEWDSSLLQWTFDLSNLSDGKHTIHLECYDVNGNEAYDLLVPFWIGEGSSFEWNDALIYMVMTDRFVNGNTSNDGNTTSAAHGADWLGGDFAGVTTMIESGYFSELGVNALWLSPFNTAATGTGKASDGVHDVSAFHGYWPTEARGIEPRLGTDSELKHLVEMAHDSGIRVMMDFVVNHVHEDHSYVQDHPNWFNAGCQCGTMNCDWTEHRLDCQFTSYMPDVNWKDRNASEQFISDALWWIETFDLDGARVDAVKHVEDLAIRNLVAQINQRFETVGTDYYLKGETAMGWSGHSLEANQEQYGAINSYMGAEGLDGQADFVLYHA
ncbi:MAG: alpha-amylase family glycosyl hydrolase, partial [Candidatus Poseidoniaceae archaeon]|nr:alpha-amylase family glycosyl hydrolase [Candidatus Poseidoniaceae archaeon]